MCVHVKLLYLMGLRRLMALNFPSTSFKDCGYSYLRAPCEGLGGYKESTEFLALPVHAELTGGISIYPTGFLCVPSKGISAPSLY